MQSPEERHVAAADFSGLLLGSKAARPLSLQNIWTSEHLDNSGKGQRNLLKHQLPQHPRHDP